MKALIRQHAHNLGFDACGFALATPPADGRRFTEWLNRGRHGEMGYLERTSERRQTPARLLSGVRTVISLAVSYPSALPAVRDPASHRTASSAAPAGVVARYARSRDYHDVVAPPLKALAQFVQQLGGPNTQVRTYLDTGPILERAFGQASGLGFIGKHTNLISRSLGNWFFLAEILTDLEVEPDKSEPNRCGSCTRCLTACPTQAIIAPYQLDARLCISYLTIELKGSIPEGLRPAIGHRIFGCDDCLQACPWNRFASEGKLMRAVWRHDLELPDLLALLVLDDDSFRRRFRETPMWRGKRPRLLRNVCVALGNIAHDDALSALHRASQDPHPLIAEHAHWAIQAIERRARGHRP